MLFELLTKRYPGMRFWLLQRITAFAMALFIPIAIAYYLSVMPSTYREWLTFNQPIWWRTISCLFGLSICLHAWIGVRDVFRDYIPLLWLRNALQIGVEISVIVYLVWTIILFWSI